MIPPGTAPACQNVAFKKLVKAERALVNARRAKLRRTTAEKVPSTRPHTGLALSGGGIRSATFCLGLAQALSRAKLVPYVDYMSTVSGGSYFGSFFGALFVGQKWRGDGNQSVHPSPTDPVDPLGHENGEAAIRRLRDSGRYLAPAGTSDAFYGAAIVVRNWAAVQLVIGGVALALFWLVGMLDRIERPAAWGVPSWVPSGVGSTLSIALAVCLLWAAAAAYAYWLTRRDYVAPSRIMRAAGNLFLWCTAAGVAYFATSLFWRQGRGPVADDALMASGAVAGWLFAASLLAVILFAMAEFQHGEDVIGRSWRGRSRSLPGVAPPQSALAAEDAVRTALSRRMSGALMTALPLAALLLTQLLAQELFHTVKRLAMLFSASADFKWADIAKSVAAVAAAVLPPLTTFLANRKLKSAGEVTSAWGVRIALAAGLGLVFIWLVVWGAVAHASLEGLREPSGTALATWLPLRPAALTLLALLAACTLVGMVCYTFINLSSLSTFYASRLRRAYIGASSRGRTIGSVQADDPQDLISLRNYYRGCAEGMAPIHLVNVTIAETQVGESTLVARDRKGKPMHLSPCGIVYEDKRPGETAVLSLESGEELPLANWIAISGAAVSAAIGSGTSLGTSILATMSNVRLGYWWKSGIGSANSRLLDFSNTVQGYLFAELRGDFPGTRRARWYLTDGGHFENTGVYALLQREVPFIIACDNGADPEYAMDDVVRLIGRARTDLGADIDFLDDAAISKLVRGDPGLVDAIGGFDRLVKPLADSTARGGPVAALATITYNRDTPARTSRGLLLLIKPRLTLSEPPELLAYWKRPTNRAFPQQPTADQFFDEEQWEAYRQLGEIVGERLFANNPTGGWSPQAALKGRQVPFDDIRVRDEAAALKGGPLRSLFHRIRCGARKAAIGRSNGGRR